MAFASGSDLDSGSSPIFLTLGGPEILRQRSRRFRRRRTPYASPRRPLHWSRSGTVRHSRKAAPSSIRGWSRSRRLNCISSRLSATIVSSSHGSTTRDGGSRRYGLPPGRLYRSTDRLCRCGAPMEYLAHSASLQSGVTSAPSKPGIKHLGHSHPAKPGRCRRSAQRRPTWQLRMWAGWRRRWKPTTQLRTHPPTQRTHWLSPSRQRS